MKKKLFLMFLFIVIFVSGCSIKRDTMEDINIYTTTYPIEYIVNNLYGKHSIVKSIYPRGVISNKYELTDIEIKEISKGDLFVFDGLSKEQSYINSMRLNNKRLKIIDATKTIYYEYGEEELWINPSNVLMAAQNIKNGLDEYISNKYLKNDIEKNYKELKLTISKLEAKIYLMVEECDDKNIIVSNDSLNFLTKYGFNVISLDKNNLLIEKNTETAKKLINNKQVSYIFMLDEDEKNDVITSFKDKVKFVYLNPINNITENDYKENKDYVTLMNYNIDLLRAEIYND